MSKNYRNTPEYRSWIAMRQRCLNKNRPEYERYGGRGIGICKRWDDFQNFLDDMGKKPNKKLSLDRINNNGNYEPANCRWADWITQRSNQRVKGKSKFFGVHLKKYRSGNSSWIAVIRLKNNKQKHIGTFDNESLASQAFNLEALKNFGHEYPNFNYFELKT